MIYVVQLRFNTSPVKEWISTHYQGDAGEITEIACNIRQDISVVNTMQAYQQVSVRFVPVSLDDEYPPRVDFAELSIAE